MSWRSRAPWSSGQKGSRLSMMTARQTAAVAMVLCILLRTGSRARIRTRNCRIMWGMRRWSRGLARRRRMTHMSHIHRNRHHQRLRRPLQLSSAFQVAPLQAKAGTTCRHLVTWTLLLLLALAAAARVE